MACPKLWMDIERVSMWQCFVSKIVRFRDGILETRLGRNSQVGCFCTFVEGGGRGSSSSRLADGLGWITFSCGAFFGRASAAIVYRQWAAPVLMCERGGRDIIMAVFGIASSLSEGRGADRRRKLASWLDHSLVGHGCVSFRYICYLIVALPLEPVSLNLTC